MSSILPLEAATRDDLMQRITLMEDMIAEGRRSTTRCGWIFVLWGLVDLAALSWRFFQPDSSWVGAWAWPVCLIAGGVLTLVGYGLQRRERRRGTSLQCRSVEAVWSMMGIAMAIYISSAMVRHVTGQFSYIAALLTIVGLAHAISAVILRWRVQGVVAGIWWVGAIGVFSARSPNDVEVVMFAEMCLGMIAFGLYAMMLERRNDGDNRHR